MAQEQGQDTATKKNNNMEHTIHAHSSSSSHKLPTDQLPENTSTTDHPTSPPLEQSGEGFSPPAQAPRSLEGAASGGYNVDHKEGESNDHILTEKRKAGYGGM